MTFSCQDCHDPLIPSFDEHGLHLGEIRIPGDDGEWIYLCDPCLSKLITDTMLDMVNDGELQIAPNGREFETTALWAAKRKYERGEDR